MVLADREIRDLMAMGLLSIDPLGPNSIQPASVDCTLDDQFATIVASDEPVTLDSVTEYEQVCSTSYELKPGSFVLATTKEYIKLADDITAFVEGRSSIGRMGLFVENAGWVDPGFEGQITLELFNASPRPIILDAGRRICQLVFCRMSTSAASPYRGKYVGQRGAVGSRIHMDKEADTLTN